MDKEQLIEYMKELIIELKENKISPKHLAREIMSIDGFFQVYFDYIMYNDDISLDEYERYHSTVFHYLNYATLYGPGK